MVKDTCGECQFFGTEACDLAPRKANEEGCGDFHRKRKSSKTWLGDYFFERKGHKVYVFNKNGEIVTSTNARSVDSVNFKKELKKVTGLEKSEIDKKTAAYQLSLQEGSLQEKKPRTEYKDSGYVNEGFVEAIYHDDKPCFLVLNDKTFSLLSTVSYNDKTFNPKEKKRIPYDPYSFFKGVIPNREEMFWKVRREFQIFIDLEQIWLDVLSACVLLSYQQEKLLTVPYIYVYGDNESGKSTVLQLLKFLCYRPMYGVTVPAADIYGYLDDVDAIGCVLEDEIQGINKDIDKIKIYKAGYKEGAVVPRTFISQNNREIRYYNTFSFKAVASERIPSVKGFRERFIEISMVEGYPEKEWTDITKEDLARLHDLRNILLKWRMLSREWALPNPEVPMRGRLKEIWKPILQITHGLTVYDTLSNFVENQRNERLAAKQNALEGHIVKIVTELYNQAKDNPNHIPFSTIWFKLSDDLDGKIDDNKPHVMDTAEFFRVTKSKVGYRLREVLSGKSKVVREKDLDGNWVSTKAYVFDQKKIRRVAKKYGYEIVTKLPSLPSSESVETPNSTLTTYEKNVEEEVSTPQKLGKVSNSVTKPLTIQETLVLLQSKWTKGYEQDFTKLVMEVKGCNLQEAEQLREKMFDEGVVAYDNEGLLQWVR